MSKDKTKKVSVFSILIFILCGLLAIYTIWSAISVTSYIGEMIEYGSVTVSDNLFDILSYYMTNCVNYIIYIAILLAIWWTKHSLTAKKAPETAVADAVKVEEIEEITEVIKDADGKVEVKETITETATIDENDESAYPVDAVKEFKQAMNIPIEEEENK